MGYWCTIHLFDDTKFYKEIVPQLKGQTGDLTAVCSEFLKSYITGGTGHLSTLENINLAKKYIDRIHLISNSFDQSFRIHNEFNKINDYDHQLRFLSQFQGYYDFCRFFEYILFTTSADFFPHVALGKGGVLRNFDIQVKSIAYNIVEELDCWNRFFTGEMMGIANWITHEDVELLYLDKEKLCPVENSHAEGFLNLLEIARRNKLGLLMGVDMRENILKLLPAHKLINIDSSINKSDGVLWKHE